MKRMRKNHESTKREGRFKREQEDVMPNSKLKPLLRRCFACAAVIVVFFTTYSMILPAITASIPTCGIEEHVHSSECYRIEKKLICENTDPEHVHSEECYSKREVLSCGKEEHVHFDECFADVGEPENKAGENTSGESKQGDRNSTDAPPYAEIDPTDPSEPGGNSDINPTDWEGLMRSEERLPTSFMTETTKRSSLSARLPAEAIPITGKCVLRSLQRDSIITSFQRA